MRIQNNIMAMNTHRMYTTNNNNVAKSAEKLSSGYRINRAGDDAAGLAISEKMRAQIRGLNMASKNSQDAVSLVQTAEGALQEVHSMLQRMNELAVQAASDTNDSGVDRAALQQEFSNLQDEIDQIASTTKFNNMALLDGTGGAGSATGTPVAPNVTGALTDAAVGGVTEGDGMTTMAEFTVDLSGVSLDGAGQFTLTIGGQDITVNVDAAADGTAIADLIAGETFSLTLNGNEHTFDIAAADGVLTFTSTVDQDTNSEVAALTASTSVAAPAAPAAGGITGSLTDAAVGGVTEGDGMTTMAEFTVDLSGVSLDGAGQFTLTIGGQDITVNVDAAADGTAIADLIAGETFSLTLNGNEHTFDIAAADGVLTFTSTVDQDTNSEVAALTASTAFEAADDGGAVGTSSWVIQVGAEEGQTLNISISAMNTAGLAITKTAPNTGVDVINNTAGGAVSIHNRESAAHAISRTRTAINTVSTQRAELGAMQNRLEHKIANLDNTAENLSSAESRIRDVDIAKEMTNFTKNNILAQASTAMLAQANAAPQGVLSLLQ